MASLLKTHDGFVAGLGYGAKRRWQAAELLDGFRCWRTDIFLHQLTTNGNLLMVSNSNPMWRDCLSSYIGQPNGLSWGRQFSLLKHLPRSLVRTAAWRASYDWYFQALMVQRDLHNAAIMTNTLVPLLGSQWYEDYNQVLYNTGVKLRELSWCYQPYIIDTEIIDVEDEN